ncbi:MAG: hypothetical protein NTX22_06270 [Ignavibacteriales bacterium]|nr:hypothetical protein [Ignavibacteriales bacterium]
MRKIKPKIRSKITLITFLLSGILFNKCTTDVTNNNHVFVGFENFPNTQPTGNVSFTVQYVLDKSFSGKKLWIGIQKKLIDGTREDIIYIDYSLPNSNTDIIGPYTFQHNFSQAGNYDIWAGAGSEGMKPWGDKGTGKAENLEITGNTADLKFLLVQEAQRYVNYEITWYNRNGNVLKDDDQNNDATKTRTWTQSLPYSYINYDNLDEIVNKINNWQQMNQSHWYDYTPGKIGFNLYDYEYCFTDQDYPWPKERSNWTGTSCQAFIYNCAKATGYSFTSDEKYKNDVAEWENIGTEINAFEAQPGDIVYFEQKDNSGILVVASHVAIISASALDEANIKLIQALGVYYDPFKFQVSTDATIGQTKLAIKQELLQQPTCIYRRLPLQ